MGEVENFFGLMREGTTRREGERRKCRKEEDICHGLRAWIKWPRGLPNWVKNRPDGIY